ncbi:MAG: hydroxyacid dehydrogenase [Clostridia bacterium]|nr:hydroxyacid dehydrogenase [Clostridia bacterium]
MRILTTTSSFGEYEIPENIELIKNPYQRKLTEQELLSLLLEYKPSGLIAGLEPVTEAVMKQCDFLKVVSRCGVGIENVDIKAAEKAGIKVFNTPEAPVASVAELTVTLILMLLKKIKENEQSLRKGNWKGPKGSMLFEKKAAVLGYGRIGKKVASLLEAFGAEIIVYDINQGNLEHIIMQADIITLHLPYNIDTKNIISMKMFEKMKSTCLLINTARGGLINEDDLYIALKDKIISGAAIDCFLEEPYHGKLCELDNIILSPHMASSSIEARAQMEQEALKNVLDEMNRLESLGG